MAFFTAVAIETWARRETTEAGRALEAGIDEIEATAVGLATVLDDTTAAAIGRARWFAGRLAQGTSAAPDEFRQAYEAVGAALESIRRSVEEEMASSPFGPAGPRLDDATPIPGEPDSTSHGEVTNLGTGQNPRKPWPGSPVFP